MGIERDHAGTVKSDRTLLRIINGLQELDGAGVTDLAGHLDLPKSTVHKHLKTLHQEGYVTKQCGTYRLGFRFLTHGGYVRDQHELCTLAAPKVRELANKMDELTLFSVKEGDYGFFIYMYNDKYGLNESAPLGAQFHLHENSAGKAILAELPDEEIEEIINRVGLPRKTQHTVSDRDELFDRIKRIRDVGFALNFEERREGIQAAASAVHHPETDSYGALSIAGPTNRLEKERLEQEYADALLGAVNELEIQINYGR
jgi:DNA-binding IclR family transcriptional regulator